MKLMYLKRVETIGFKSFAEKTMVQFEPGVTAVVGPNGSGKSNISDAIRWVLGEQSAKSLRGGKMEDIIFAGTSTRKPLNFAEVTLVLDNSCNSLPLDFEEVSITRRVYRTGDSEYLINKQKVRLKDVIDLMMDSGIGHDSLSIISQDKVKAIVETRDEERRVIIEEAAGVLKYKNRKKEATRKLLATNNNLNRVHDIIYELEDQVEPLRKQSEKAEKYVVLKEEVSKAEISVLAQDIKLLNNQLTQAKKDQQEYDFRQISHTAKMSSDEQKRDALKEKKQQQEQSLEALQHELVETSEAIQKLQGQRDVLKERRKNTSSNKEQLASLQADLQSRFNTIESELQTAKLTEKKTRATLAEKQEQLIEVSKEYQHLEETLKTQLEAKRNDYFTDINQLTHVKNQYSAIGERLKQVGGTLEQIQKEKNQLSSEQEQYHIEMNDFKKKYESLENSLQEKSREYQSLQNRCRQQQQEAESSENHYRQLLQQQDKITNRLQWLEEAQKDFSGFNDGVKKILQAREQKQLFGVEGAVAELISIPKDLELAMDIVLGAAMQQIVTTSDEAAKGAIQFLKQNRAGRATFLPLNVIKSRYLPDQVLHHLHSEQEVIGVASDLVRYDNRYRQVFENLLGNIIVTKHLNVANQLARKLNYRYRIVTLEGDVVNAGGAMTGGAVKRQGSSLLRQKNEIETCKQQIKHLNEEIKQSEQDQKTRQEQLATTHKELTKLQQTGERLKNKRNELNQQKVAFDYRSSSLKQRAQILSEEEANHSEAMKQLVNENNDLADKRVFLEERIKEAKVAIETLESQLDQQEELKAQLLQEMTELKIEVAKLETNLQSEQLTAERLNGDLVQTRQQLHTVLERIDNSEQALSGSDHEVEQLERAVEKTRLRREEIIADIQNQRLRLTKVNEDLERLEREVRESRRILQKLVETMNENAVSIGKMDVEIDLMIRKIEEEHQMTFDYAHTHYPLKGKMSEVKELIRRLKGQISALGEVNLGAIQEYQRVKDRYDFLTTQRDDLIDAKTNLEATIAEMDQEMNVKFKETFDLVRVHYIDIFKKLFGGGTADLVLAEPHDLLNTGVEIIAQPPGTNLKTSNLLSGGQKALTSIALLFAILKVRTVPFCVLDEVEAALDEANVTRYANYLKLFSKETQFIVITHRKGTMEHADVLYGVTMQERGVTKLVAVRMENVVQYLADESA